MDWQPIFYPVLNRQYAEQIACDWNAVREGYGSLTEFRVPRSFLERYPVRVVGGAVHQELWVRAEELQEFNANIVGDIQVIAEFNEPRGAEL